MSALQKELFGSADGSHATASEVSLSWFAHPEAVKHVEMSPKVAPSGPIGDADDFRRRRDTAADLADVVRIARRTYVIAEIESDRGNGSCGRCEFDAFEGTERDMQPQQRTTHGLDALREHR